MPIPSGKRRKNKSPGTQFPGMDPLRKEEIPTKRIVKARIDWLSLCPKGKNKLAVLYKEDGTTAALDAACLLVKSDMDKGELTALVYVPEKVDTDGDFASAEVIKEMAYDFSRNGAKLDLRHDEKPLTKDQAFVAENFLVQKGDPRFSDVKDEDGKPVQAEGAWAVVVKIDDPDLRALYKAGGWSGVSMGGRGRRVPDKPVTKEQDVDPKLLSELISKAVAESVAPLKAEIESLKKAPAPKDSPKTEADENGLPIFKGDPTSAKDVLAHRQNLLKAKALKDVDWADETSVAAYHDALTKAPPSNQPPSGGKGKAQGTKLQDRMEKGREHGSRLAGIANRARGYKVDED